MNPYLVAALVLTFGVIVAVAVADAREYLRQVKNPRPGRIL